MGRRKIEIKAIKDDRNRSVTFLKRKGGLFKKAHELAVLCSVDVAVIIFGHNKKLYEFSSCDMRETLARYQYFGPPHEHKGPEDFNGKRDDDDDDDDDGTPAPEDMHPTPQNPPQMMPAHIPGHPGFQHVNHAPSASPPIPNGIPFDPRHGTPQPQGASRPSSRNHLRRVSSNLGGPSHHGTPPPPPPQPPQNGFAYMPNPSVYNPNAPHHMGQQPPRPGQYAHFGHHPQHQQPHQPMPPHSMPPHTMPPQPMPPHPQPPLQHLQQHPPHPAPQIPQMTMSQPPHPTIQVAQSFLPDQQQPPQRTASLPETSTDQMPGQMKMEGSQSPPQPKPLPSKSRSIFTPIDDRGSVLAQQFGLFGGASHAKMEPGHDESNDRKPSIKPVPPPRAATEVPMSKAVPDIKPPIRTNSGQMTSKRPQLKVQIPSESSDRGSATAESSSRDSAGNKAVTPAKANPDTNHPGVVLPPPSPSAGAILSAGAQGPPNPFARPPPPGTTVAAQNNNSYNNNNNIETPISALPSRFVSDALLPSPSSFFPEWGFGRSGPDSNMLPSPLTFPTPAVQNGPGFGREEEQDKKRKSPDSGASGEGTTKKAKT
ncbi:hypothetical protein P175DRAFT_0445671 [Aspergillus ochraceoroseus IBT 24754]|uniref:SRF-type transcription factor RlmA n=3 Tax=Aspergillus subgen. Nidulantes TaxID=2720870 RepID=A0A0F8UJK1_9EURO|nr:uncharacterized protein P175DRAFT_0445671 [Aspergillus ochraceoroseus IBT 24754]KKK12083.1 SRF-type transcription factor RlmA [Aspergillus ochraceoroseus]KKK19794.1 SRF-type transcription factor RlmA [Aspergillus rambellii]PTU17530.1 hypothetical protein P175DRAFT_0445671 [Aspergillus ochraceoroseus IBT 24754]